MIDPNWPPYTQSVPIGREQSVNRADHAIWQPLKIESNRSNRAEVPIGPGKHSDQGSMIPEIRQYIRSRKKISGHSDRVLAQNFDAVLAGIVIWAGDTIFAKFCQGM